MQEKFVYGRLTFQIIVKAAGGSYNAAWSCERCGKQARLETTFVNTEAAVIKAREAAKIHALVHRN